MMKIGDMKKLVLCLILLSINAIILPEIFQSISISIFMTHICSIILIYIFFKQKFRNAFGAYTLIYSILSIWILIFGNLLYGMLEQILPIGYMKIVIIALMYGSQVILFVLCIAFKLKIKQIYKLLLSGNISISYTTMFSFIPDFLLSLYFISYDIDNSLIRNSVIIGLVAFLVLNIVLFIKTVKKAIYINKLNETLITKNDKLKNIKNDYGLQMLCLYELCDMEKFNDVSSLLKSIISENSSNIAEKSINKSSLLSLATRHLIHNNIKVVIKDNANFKLAEISEIELYRVIVNIINNAIKAMKNKGTIIAKSYEDLNNVIITIENDGEKIPEEIIDKIFEAGFTTKKNNNKNHGYGLNIVKDLIENQNGNIFVESNEDVTKFTIALPIKEAT